ncbi:bone morphogenetic protein 5-like [Gouania willdenowi]|uniref:Bone morphogenetic protein 5-like n=1 Tax=Gouania willdenowi TaxID=441366 RepID=A0A8C5EDG6_GOUWI|nr:bone morphogenetic protein 5-like [Gouania willdenowi]
MSFAFIVMTMLLGSSLAFAFVLHPSNVEAEASANSAASSHRCQADSRQWIRKGLLEALGLKTEPLLPAGGLDSVREQWKRTFSTIPQNTASSPSLTGNSISPIGGNSSGLMCCTTVSEIYMKDLNWDNWVIHPLSLTMVQCALCNPGQDVVECPFPNFGAQDTNSQVDLPCCQPIAFEMVPILYMDEPGTVVISSVKLPRSCSCGPGTIHQ